MISELARRVASLAYEDLSEAAKERLSLCILGNISVAVAGVPYCVLPEPGGADGPFRLFSGRRTTEGRDAAFWNAGTMHARTQDDFHPVGNLHVGTVVLPAVLAVADTRPMTGRAFLEAVAAGYMVGVGLSRSYSPSTTPRGLRSTGLYAPFGAAAAVARASGASTDETASALALTTAFAAGTTQAWVDGSDEWQVHPAHGAASGLEACRLAARGVRGGEHALDGVFGFYRAVTSLDVSPDQMAKDLDPSAAIEENVIKRFPVSGICQSVVLASREVAGHLAGDSGPIRRVVVEMNPFEMRYPGTLNRGTLHSFGARLMSAAFCSASVLAHGDLVFADFHGAEHPERDRLADLVEVREDKGLPLLSARLTIEAADGRSLTHEVKNSRDDVAITWDSVDDWASALWQEAGRTADAYRACREAVRDLATASTAMIPF